MFKVESTVNPKAPKAPVDHWVDLSTEPAIDATARNARCNSSRTAMVSLLAITALVAVAATVLAICVSQGVGASVLPAAFNVTSLSATAGVSTVVSLALFALLRRSPRTEYVVSLQREDSPQPGELSEGVRNAQIGNAFSY